ncbi:ATP-dependent zinc metalloprotease FTSH, chloroplastic [Fagus crenata]
MASTNPLLSSHFLGTKILVSPPTPKTTKSPLPFPPFSKRKSILITQNLLNKKPNSKPLNYSIPSKATLAALIFSTLTPQPQALALDNLTPPQSPPVIEAQPTKPNNSNPSPFSQNLLLTAPKPQTQTVSDLPEGSQWRYSEFLSAVKKGKVERVRFSKEGSALQLTAVDGRRASVIVPNDPDLIDILAMNGVDISVAEGESGNGLFNFIGNLIFPVLAFAGLFFLFRRAQGGPGGPGGLGGPMDFGRSKSKFQEVPETGVTFSDVAGADQAKLELQEVVDFLKNPDKYTALGAKIPKGCLLVGPPGTGKTLLARAVAGEAGVPFFSCAASEFVELFVGVGASRVRDLFEKAKSKAPCIVFIDEIDAVGRQRGAGMGGGNDEREQTINQLLTEMDGFSGNSGVIVLAATNRPDVLDSALLRPGRFDRQVTVDRPDVAGRVKILQVHSRGKALAKDVDFDKIARRTPGFTGADLQNLMNEAAILAARRDLKEISKDEISDALERIIAGPEKKNAVVSEEKKKLVAYHEAGHALVGALMPEYDPVAKISIIPRGQAGGLTFFAPSEERLESGLYSRSYLENQMAVALGGRVAEEIIFGDENVTTGASNDFMQVSRVARQMVERFGFSKKIGQVAIGAAGGNPFLGQQMSSQKDYSMATADIVDAEVRELVEKAYSRAKQIMTTHIDILHKLAQLLIEKETVDGEEFMSLFIDGKAELYVS